MTLRLFLVITALVGFSVSATTVASTDATSSLASLLSYQASSTFDYVFMAALVGGSLMLIFINIGQALIRQERLNIYLALYIAIISTACICGWNSVQTSPLLPTDQWIRKSFTLLTLAIQAFLIYQYFLPRPAMTTWTRLFIGIHVALIAVGLWLITVEHAESYRAVRLLLLISASVCVVHTALMIPFKIPFTRYFLVSKIVAIGLAVSMWITVENTLAQGPLFYWFAQSVIIIESMIVTYALVMRNIQQTNNRLQTHFQRSAKLKLKKQYNQTLKRIDNELRTPLSGVVGIAELLLDTSLNKTQRDQIVTMRRSGEALLKWLNRLNDWRSLQIGRLNFDNIPFDFSHLLNTLCEDSKVKAEDRKIQLQYTPNPNAPTLIKGDPARIKQIISGTLEMALYYSEQGNVEVNLKASAQRNCWRLEIRDCQSGLHMEDIDLTLSNEAEIEAGTLSSVQRNWAIAQALAEHIGGSLNVTINDNGEALFICELILTRYSLLQHHENHYDKLLKDKRLLIVDDSSSSRKLLAKRAESWGMKVTCVPNGQDALDMINTMSKIGGVFDCIILDHDMPGLTGLEVAKTIVDSRSTLETPTMIMLSGANNPPNQDQASSAAIKRVLSKPITAKSLKITLAEELTLHQVRQRERKENTVALL